ncbi:MAG: ABC transporter substrate-binding protein [Acidobacteriota bacterium]|nr:ABC transporter substrate-binding protein [Acidobacteriota bacterium]
MFYGLATKKVRSSFVTFRHVLSDIETLNRKALEGFYDLTAISYHAYPYVADKYHLMAAGSSVGDGYGPLVVATHPMEPEEIKGRKIAIPGTMTTAYLALKIFEPDFEPVIVPFDKILETVQSGAVEAGLIIHEAQLTYNKEGFHRVLDMGKWWKDEFGLPLPLGCNVLRKKLSGSAKTECCRMMKDSIQYALDNHAEALEYAMQFARDMEPRLAEKFVGMYVNHYTLDAGEDIPKAAQRLFDMGFEAGIIPNRVEADFVR